MKPALLDIPSRIETDRLELLMPETGDGAAMNAAIVESIAELAAWMPWARPTPSPDDTEKWCREAQAKFLLGDEFHYALRLKPDGVIVGGIGLFNVNWNIPRVEVGYWVRTTHSGRGLMAEAVRAAVGLAFGPIKAERVEIRCDDRNAKSGRVAERAGFQLEAVLRRHGRGLDGELADTRIYSLLRQ